MSETSMFFNSEDGDIREYSAAHISELLSGICKTGVLEGLEASKVWVSSDENALKVTAGKAMINGYFYSLDEDITFNIPFGEAVRYDRIVLRLDRSSRSIKIEYKKGDDNSNAPPELVQNSEVYEISVANMLISGETAYIISVYPDAEYSKDYHELKNKPILYGTTAPVNSQGSNGDIYILYKG